MAIKASLYTVISNTASISSSWSIERFSVLKTLMPSSQPSHSYLSSGDKHAMLKILSSGIVWTTFIDGNSYFIISGPHVDPPLVVPAKTYLEFFVTYMKRVPHYFMSTVLNSFCLFSRSWTIIFSALNPRIAYLLSLVTEKQLIAVYVMCGPYDSSNLPVYAQNLWKYESYPPE